MLKGCLIGLLAFFGILAVAGFVLFFLAARPIDLSHRMTPVNVTVQGAQSFDAKIDGLKAALALAPPGTKLSVSITQDEATSKLDIYIKTSSANIPAKDVVLNFHEGYAEVGGVMNMGGGDRTFLVDASAQVKDGAFGVEVTKVRIGALPVPPGFIEGFSSSFAPGVDLSHIPFPSDLGFTVTRITFTEGIVILEATK